MLFRYNLISSQSYLCHLFGQALICFVQILLPDVDPEEDEEPEDEDEEPEA